jgi:beta-lactamase regulating signal transducer with metallopeptidase domain
METQMSNVSLALWAVGGLIAVGGLVKLMLVRRNQVVAEWKSQADAERKKKKKQEAGR